MSTPGDPARSGFRPDATRSRPSPKRVTELLARAHEGSRDACRDLFPIVYDELRGLAGALLHNDPAQTLQPTALVHEAFLKLLRQESAGCKNRAEFLGVAAQAMRRILVDHARGKQREKRGGGRLAVELDEAVATFEARAVDLIALDAALERLGQVDARKSRLVELRFFAGLSLPDVSSTTGTPLRTCERDWKMARAWLRKELAG